MHHRAYVGHEPTNEKINNINRKLNYRDASCQLKSCQWPRNGAETTCTTCPVWRSLCDLMFSRFSRTPTCDRHTQTDTGPWLVPRMVASRGKNYIKLPLHTEQLDENFSAT